MQKKLTPTPGPTSTLSYLDDGRTTLLLTGFGPFPSVPVNATMLLVPRLAIAARQLFPGVRIVTDILPTEWIAAPTRVDHLLATHRPDIVLHFGVSSRARGFEIEMRGRNQCVMAPDAVGAHPRHTDLGDDGPLLQPSRVPVEEIVRRLRRHHLPAFRSWTAGAYLCNATLYHVLTQIGARPVQAGFVHIPALLAPRARLSGHRRQLSASPGCPLTWMQTLTGSLEIIATLLDQPSPHPTRSRTAWQRHI